MGGSCWLGSYVSLTRLMICPHDRHPMQRHPSRDPRSIFNMTPLLGGSWHVVAVCDSTCFALLLNGVTLFKRNFTTVLTLCTRSRRPPSILNTDSSYVHMYVYIHTYIYIYIRIHTDISIRTNMYGNICIFRASEAQLPGPRASRATVTRAHPL